MTLRLIIRTDNADMAVHVGGAVLTSYRTIDVHLPEVELVLRAGGRKPDGLCHSQLVGCEVLNDDEPRP